MVQSVVRAWMWVAIARVRPETLPKEWRDKPQLFSKCVLGFRNLRLGVLVRMQRYISGKQSITTLDRIRKQEEKLSKVDKMRQSALVNTVKSLDVAELSSALVAGTAEIGISIVKDGSSLVKDGTPTAGRISNRVANTAEIGVPFVKDGQVVGQK